MNIAVSPSRSGMLSPDAGARLDCPPGDADPLTGLPGRVAFFRDLKSMLRGAPDSLWSLALCNIDGFAHVNDMVGHQAADQMLQAVADRLSDAFGSISTVARIGGDDFALLFSPETAQAAAGLIRHREAALRSPIEVGGYPIEPSISIGFGCGRGSMGEETLLRCAGAALRSAKSRARGMLVEFTPEMGGAAREKAAALREARSALAEDRIVPVYQPKISLIDGALTGFEALMRVRDRRGRLTGPRKIMPAFEDADTASLLGARMRDRVFADMYAWRASGTPFGRIAVNASAAEFRNGQFASTILAGMDDAGLPASLIEVEVTETVFVGARGQFVAEALCALNDAGARIALDDFGTGYASLCHLRDFPVDTIKIDRSFIRGIDAASCSAAITHAVVSVGRSLGMDVVAEGIETQGEHDFLVEIGCPMGQGYLYGAGVGADEVGEAVQRIEAAQRQRVLDSM